MVRTLRSALALLVVSLGLAVLIETPAFACDCAPRAWKQQVRTADVVFIASVDRVSSDKRGDLYSLTASRVYKGEVERVTEVVSPSACLLGELRRGKEYVFLATGDEAPYRADGCGGTSAANPTRLAKVEQELGEGQAVAPPPPPTADLTRVEESPPLGFARLAAPGGAAIIVALLGLFVVRRLARR